MPSYGQLDDCNWFAGENDHRRVLESHLQSGEQVLFACVGKDCKRLEDPNSSAFVSSYLEGCLIVTTQRVLFQHPRGFLGRKTGIASEALEKIAGVMQSDTDPKQISVNTSQVIEGVQIPFLTLSVLPPSGPEIIKLKQQLVSTIETARAARRRELGFA